MLTKWTENGSPASRNSCDSTSQKTIKHLLGTVSQISSRNFPAPVRDLLSSVFLMHHILYWLNLINQHLTFQGSHMPCEFWNKIRNITNHTNKKSSKNGQGEKKMKLSKTQWFGLVNPKEYIYIEREREHLSTHFLALIFIELLFLSLARCLQPLGGWASTGTKESPAASLSNPSWGTLAWALLCKAPWGVCSCRACLSYDLFKCRNPYPFSHSPRVWKTKYLNPRQSWSQTWKKPGLLNVKLNKQICII